jgi:hypothetical protein
MNKFLSRKFLLAVLFSTVSSALAWVGKLDGTQWVAMAGIIIGAFNLSDVALNHIHKGKADPDNPT